MTIRSFWTVLIKLLGVYVILQAITAIPSLLGAVSYFMIQPDGRNPGSGIYTLSYFIVIVGIFAILLWACLAKTDWIIDKLKLDKGFTEDRFEISMHRSSILKIVIILIGGFTLVDSVPDLCKDTYSCLEQSLLYEGFKKNPASSYLLLNLIRTFIGIFMVTSSQLIVNFIERKKREPMIETP